MTWPLDWVTGTAAELGVTVPPRGRAAAQNGAKRRESVHEFGVGEKKMWGNEKTRTGGNRIGSFACIVHAGEDLHADKLGFKALGGKWFL